MKELTKLSLAIATSIGLSAGAMAASNQIEEVVVTATRTSENIQDVPIAVTALTGKMLEDQGIINPSDLQMSAPSLSFTATNFGGSSFSIRGIGNLVIGGESGVSTHTNEISIASNLNAIEFFDLERVEVLRGPQGTLFGRNATGGAVNFVTKKPDYESVNGFIDVEAGDYDHIRVKGAVNVPITDNFAVRFAGMTLERDGYIDNLAYGQVADNGVGAGVDTISGIDSDLDGRDITTYRVTAQWEITDDSSLWVMYTDFDEDDDRARVTNQVCVTTKLPTTGCEPNGVGFESPHAVTGTGGIIFGLSVGAFPLVANPTRKYNRPEVGFRKMHTDFDPVFKQEEQILAFGYEYEFENYTLGITGAYQETQYLAQQDYYMDVGALLFDGSINFPVSRPAGAAGDDFGSGPCSYNDGTSGAQTAGTPAGGCSLPIDGSVVFAYDQADTDTEYWTAEAKLASSLDGKFNFVVGVNAYNAESFSDYYVLGNSLDVAGAYPGFFNNTDDPDKPVVGDGWAVFTETYYDFSDTLKFTLGLRYNEDSREDFGTNILLNSFDLNNTLGGALGASTQVRVPLGGFIFGAPLGDQTALANLYGVDQATIDAAELTGPASPERIGIATTIPPVPQGGEARFLTGSPTDFDFDAISGRIGFDWAMNENTMLYGFFSRGYKPGGLNPAIPVDFQGNSSFSYDEEEIDAIEFGIKSTLLDGTMVMNTAVYVYDYTGLQTTRIVNNSSINDNIDADIWGAELEIFWKPEAIQNLDLAFSYAYTNTEVVDSTSIDPTNRTAGNANWVLVNNLDSGANTGINFIAEDPNAVLAAVPGCAALGATVPLPSLSYDNGIPALWSRSCLEAFGVTTSDGLQTDLDGNELPNTPEHAISFSAAYTWDLEALAGAVTLRWDYYWQGDSYAREFNTVGDEIDSWDQHNMQLQYQSNDGKWSGKLFVRNLNDDDNVTGHYLTSDTSGFYRNYFLTEPRIYGLSVRYGFGE